MKPKYKRLITLLAALGFISGGGYILLNAFSDNLVYFYPPKDIFAMGKEYPQKLRSLEQKEIRMGGMVKQGSYHKTSDLGHAFTLTDYERDMNVVYEGVLPPMFREGQGVVAQGRISVSQEGEFSFRARQLLTKHDEKYMPPEIKKIAPE